MALLARLRPDCNQPAVAGCQFRHIYISCPRIGDILQMHGHMFEAGKISNELPIRMGFNAG